MLSPTLFSPSSSLQSATPNQQHERLSVLAKMHKVRQQQVQRQRGYPLKRLPQVSRSPEEPEEAQKARVGKGVKGQTLQWIQKLQRDWSEARYRRPYGRVVWHYNRLVIAKDFSHVTNQGQRAGVDRDALPDYSDLFPRRRRQSDEKIADPDGWPLDEKRRDLIIEKFENVPPYESQRQLRLLAPTVRVRQSYDIYEPSLRPLSHIASIRSLPAYRALYPELLQDEIYLDSDLAELYQQLEGRQIRVVDMKIEHGENAVLECTLRPLTLDADAGHFGYVAVSYTWQEEERYWYEPTNFKIVPIRINGHILPVASRIAYMLKSLYQAGINADNPSCHRSTDSCLARYQDSMDRCALHQPA